MTIDTELEQVITENEGYTISNDLEADKAVERIMRIEATIERLETLTKQKIEELKMTLENHKNNLNAKIEFYKYHVAAYISQLDPKALRYTKSGNKIYDLSAGKVTVAKKDKWIYDKDNPAFISWLEDNGLEAYVVTKESVNWSELKTELEITPDGVVNKLTGEIMPKDIVEGTVIEEVKIGK